MPVDFEIKRSRRRTLSLEVRAGKLIVRSPLFLGYGQILKFVREKSSWIEEKVRKTAQSLGASSPNNALILGEPYQVVARDVLQPIVDEQNKVLYFGGGANTRRDFLKDLYLQKTQEFVEICLNAFREDFNLNGTKVKYKFYRSKWGSCSPRNDLSFNAYLSSAPPSVIRYVVIHELAHIKIKNHSGRFWEYVERFAPDYKAQRKYLKNHNIKII